MKRFNSIKIKIFLIFWFGLCLFLFVVVSHPMGAKRMFPFASESVQILHNVFAPLFFRPTVY